MSKLILMMGISGAGKSTWIKNNEKESWAIVSRDAIRFEILEERGGEYFDYEDEVFKRFIRQIIGGLVADETVVADATHLTKKARAKVLSQVRKYATEIEVVWIKVSVETAMTQNRNRHGLAKVPNDVIKSMARSIQAPNEEEGFSKITIIEEGVERVWYM